MPVGVFSLGRFNSPGSLAMKRLALLGATVLIGFLPAIASARQGVFFGLNAGGFGLGYSDFGRGRGFSSGFSVGLGAPFYSYYAPAYSYCPAPVVYTPA